MTTPLVQKLAASAAPPSVLLIRLAVGSVFLSEGIQKFLFADALGAGRFARIGIPWPDVTGPFVGAIELVCGVLILLGWLTRPAALALAIDMVVAIVSTKLPILLGHGFWGFASPAGERSGFWTMAHENRTDLAMLLGALFLLLEGAGRISLDARMARRAGSRGTVGNR